MFPRNVVMYCGSETVRQHVSAEGVVRMCDAWSHARHRSFGYYDGPQLDDVIKMAYAIEPTYNPVGSHGHNFRDTAITINGIVQGNSPLTIEGAMVRLFEHVPSGLCKEMWIDREVKITPEWMPAPVEEVDPWIKALLDIHPWADGNGRTASVLRNWLLGILDKPEALPYYYEGETH